MLPRAVDLAVLIVSHDSNDVLPRCLDALAAQCGIALEVVVVDNASAVPPAAHPRLDQLIRNRDNPGFAVACNQAAVRASAARSQGTPPQPLTGRRVRPQALS